MSDKTLLLMFDEVRRSSLQILAGLDEQTARWHPRGLQNTIRWHAGHQYVVLEWIAMRALGKAPQSPPGWFKLFGSGSRPAQVPPDGWPPLAEIIQQLKSQHVRLRALLGNLSEEQLSASARGHPDRTVREMILHAFQDEAAHKGEIWLLRKLQSKQQQP